MGIVGKKILLIEDDHTQSLLLTRALETVGCEVIAAGTVKEAIQKINSEHPDLVILDLNLPDHDGFTFLRFRKQNLHIANIPVIVLSGTTNKSDIQKAMEMGANQFLEKPFQTRIILQKIRFIFFNKKSSSYQFPKSARIKLQAEVNAHLVAHNEDVLKVDCQVRFSKGKPIRVTSEDYIKNGGSELVCKLESPLTELNENMFRSIVKAIGLSMMARKNLEKWQRGLK